MATLPGALSRGVPLQPVCIMVEVTDFFALAAVYRLVVGPHPAIAVQL